MASSVSLPTGGLDGSLDDWDAQTIGLYLAMLIVGNGAAARGGVVPSAGNPLKVSPVSGQMKVSVADGRGAVAVPNALRGVQPIFLGADEVLDVQTAHTVNDRRDIVIAEVGDFGDVALNFREIRVVQGRTDVAGAPEPTTNWVTPPTSGSGVGRDLGQGGWMKLATLFIGHGQSTFSVFDTRPTLLMPGGAPAIPGAADPATSPSGWTSWLPPGSLAVDTDADELRIYDAVRGMVEVLASGTRLDYGTFRASLTLQAGPPSLHPEAETNNGGFTLDLSQSYEPTAIIKPDNANVIQLAPNAVYDVTVLWYMPNGLSSVDYEIISAISPNEVLGVAPKGAADAQYYNASAMVYSNAHPQITTRIRNNNTISKDGVLTIMRVSRRQTGRT